MLQVPDTDIQRYATLQSYLQMADIRFLVEALQCQKVDACLQFRGPKLTAEAPGTGRAEMRAEGPAPSRPTSSF